MNHRDYIDYPGDHTTTRGDWLRFAAIVAVVVGLGLSVGLAGCRKPTTPTPAGDGAVVASEDPGHSTGSASQPRDLTRDVAAMLTIIGIGAYSSHTQAQTQGACLAWGAVSEGTRVASTLLLTQTPTEIPAIPIDVSACFGVPIGNDAAALVVDIVAESADRVRPLLEPFADDPCGPFAVASAALESLASIAEVAAEEVAHFDGEFTIPAVPVRPCP